MFTLAQLQAIEKAIGSGALIVEHDGKKVQYRSMKELLDARDVVRAELIHAGLLAPANATRVSYARRER